MIEELMDDTVFTSTIAYWDPVNSKWATTFRNNEFSKNDQVWMKVILTPLADCSWDLGEGPVGVEFSLGDTINLRGWLKTRACYIDRYTKLMISKDRLKRVLQYCELIALFSVNPELIYSETWPHPRVGLSPKVKSGER